MIEKIPTEWNSSNSSMYTKNSYSRYTQLRDKINELINAFNEEILKKPTCKNCGSILNIPLEGDLEGYCAFCFNDLGKE